MEQVVEIKEEKKPHDPNFPNIHLGDIDFTKLLEEEEETLPEQAPTTVRIMCNTEKEQFKCEQCGKSFRLSRALLNHKKTHNKKPKDKLKHIFQCFVCQEEFNQRYQLINHMRTHKEMKFRLSAISFSKLHNRKRSVIIHNMNKQYECENCNEILSSLEHFNDHKQTKCGTEFKCDICDWITDKPADLDHHLQKHRERPYKCTVCDASFFKPNTLKDHMRVHTGEKPFKCDICESSFSHQTTLRRHKRTHTGEKLYQCEICEQRFTHRSSRKRHISRIHGIDSESIKSPNSAVLIKTSSGTPQANNVEQNQPNNVGTIEQQTGDDKDRNVIQIRIGGQFADGFKPVAIFKCGVCSLGFPDFPTLQNHMEIHDENAAYKTISDVGHIEIADDQGNFTHFNPADVNNHHPGKKMKPQQNRKKMNNKWESSPLLLPGKAQSYQNHQNQQNHYQPAPNHYQVPPNELPATATFHIGDDAYIDNVFDSEIPAEYEYVDYNCPKLKSPKKPKIKNEPVKRSPANPDDSKPRPFQCNICSATFSASGILRSHMVSHTGAKPYRCEICNENFAYRSTRMRHMQVHTGKVKFSCSICTKSYSRRENLDKHMLCHA